MRVIMCLCMHEASVKTDTLRFLSGQRLTSRPLGPARARIPPRVCVRVSHTGIASDKGATLASCIPIPPKATHLFPFLSASSVHQGGVGPSTGVGPSGDWRVNKGNIFHAFFHLMPFPKKYILRASDTEGKVYEILNACFGEACCWYLILLSLFFPPHLPLKISKSIR